MTVEPRHSRLMGIAEAAEYANVHPSTLRRRIADGQLPAYRVGPKLLKVDIEDVEALIRPVPVTRPRARLDTSLVLATARPPRCVAHVHPTDRG